MVQIKNYPTSTNSEMTSTTTIASGPIIFKEGKVLLSRDVNDPFWKIPGGTVRDDESFIQTAIREAKEETGLEIEVNGDPFIYAFYKVDEETKTVRYYILIHYLAGIISEGLPGESGLQINYFETSLLPTDIAPNVKAAVDHFISPK